jgi:hypothetical protein
MSTETPLLLLSSGSRPRYLEDVVRALALPDGGHLQFRYEQNLLASGVRSHLKDHGLNGYTCYLAYLDNRTPGTKPDIIPVREALAVEVSARGSSVVFRLRVGRYIRTNELEHIQAFLEGNVQDELPTWKPDHQQHQADPLRGYWVNFLRSKLTDVQLMNHDSENGTHLGLFEESARNLIRHTQDFGEASRRLFFNIIGLRDPANKACLLSNGGWTLGPGREYRLDIYHFYPEEGPLIDRPVYWLGCRTSGVGIAVIGSGILRADSEYDSKTILIQTTGSVRATQNALTVFRTMAPSDDNAATAELVFNVEVAFDRARNVMQAIVIGTLVSLPGMIAIYPDVPSWKSFLILIGGLLAGFASVFKFSRTP